jgi:hypothetical protein
MSYVVQNDRMEHKQDCVHVYEHNPYSTRLTITGDRGSELVSQGHIVGALAKVMAMVVHGEKA